MLIPNAIKYSLKYSKTSMTQATIPFKSLGNSSDSSRKQIFRGNLGAFSYFIIKMYFVCIECTQHAVIL